MHQSIFTLTLTNKVCVSKHTWKTLALKKLPSCFENTSVSDMEAVSIMLLSVLNKEFDFSLRDLGESTVARLNFEGMDTTKSGACDFTDSR